MPPDCVSRPGRLSQALLVTLARKGAALDAAVGFNFHLFSSSEKPAH